MRRSLPGLTWPSWRAWRSGSAQASSLGRAAALAAVAVGLSTAAGAGMPADAATATPAGGHHRTAFAGVFHTAVPLAAGRVRATAAPRPVMLINGDRVVVRAGP